MLGWFSGLVSAVANIFGFARQEAENAGNDKQQAAGAAVQKSADQTATMSAAKEAGDVENGVRADNDTAVDTGLQQWTRKPSGS